MDDKILHELLEYRDGALYWKKRQGKMKSGSLAGTLGNHGYIAIKILGKHYLVHRIIFFMHNNFFPEEIDHIDGNILNNKIENLRATNRNGNTRNRKVFSNNLSGIKGVRWHKSAKKWEARLCCNKIPYSLGFFNTANDAKIALDKFRIELHGEFANHG